MSGKPITPESTLFSLRQKYRVDEETLARFKSILEEFVGTHNFWNFTVGREYKEAAAQRHIKSIEVCSIILGDCNLSNFTVGSQTGCLRKRRMAIG